MINQSLGAQTRDITYGNPAKALIDEGIHDVATGDFEADKGALRSGKTPAEASKQRAEDSLQSISGSRNTGRDWKRFCLSPNKLSRCRRYRRPLQSCDECR